MRHLPPHHRLDAGDVQPHRRDTGHLRDAATTAPRRAARRRNHLPTTASCDTCHRTTGWTPATFNHTGVTPGTCASCHNGTTARGKTREPPADDGVVRHLPPHHRLDAGDVQPHRRDTGTCATLPQRHHRARQDGEPRADDGVVRHLPPHDRVDAGDVQPHRRDAGHLRDAATTAPPHAARRATHVPTTASCDTCHRTTGWTPATFSHTGVTPGTCATCHNGTTARGKTANHVPTTASCDTCHRTTGWTPATFSHTGVTPGSVRDLPQRHHRARQDRPATCRRRCPATPATAPPRGFRRRSPIPGSRRAPVRPATTAPRPGASRPHTSSRRSPATRAIGRRAGRRSATYSHLSPGYKAHSAGLTCTSCHRNNNEVLAWPAPAYKPDCAGCHASTFRPGSHKKVDSPQILYTVAELRNCNGSCHEYTDSTFTTIRRSRTGQHRPTDGGF